jgi:SAM-dependent methyltransferase
MSMEREIFSADWLALREPFDHRSRAPELDTRLAVWWGAAPRRRVVDLGCGTGSNLRYLTRHLGSGAHWTLVDHDPALLSRVRPPEGAQVQTVEADLASDVLVAIEDAELVTASALLDLVSVEWLEDVVERCARQESAALFVLSYDGSIEWQPEDEDDDVVRVAVNAHQRRDKGLGPALGPTAATVAEEAFRKRGYQTWLAESPWKIGAGGEAMARALVDGWRGAALEELLEKERVDVDAWADRRLASVAASPGVPIDLTVGHLDLLALPE